ncbi:DUF2141 domain-containing protein [Shewanella acanthi]|uniref:DUF2141 domain-containing protein n=1 Tax=Shewanella acanthi TaxID=2864212 RepID=UPI001C65D566|nr:DUF2141 domain-containing protein [Shewanella acanthi]QYJ78833.1 DUF2141 domain-containing protein [Shewanella acanthi]
MYAKPAKAVSLLFTCIGLACSVSAQSLNVTLSGLQSDQGKLVVRVYNSDKQWLSDKPNEIYKLHTINLKDQVKDEKLEFSLDLPDGDYALSVFQDKDEDGALKSNWIGIPREPVAISNNAKGSMGAPEFKDAKFQIAGQPVLQTLNLANFN